VDAVIADLRATGKETGSDQDPEFVDYVRRFRECLVANAAKGQHEATVYCAERVQ
jgi:hypothetical protein